MATAAHTDAASTAGVIRWAFAFLDAGDIRPLRRFWTGAARNRVPPRR